MRSKVLSKSLSGMGSAMAQNLWNFSTPKEKSIWWLTEEYGLEVDPVDSKTVVERYALAVIFYATGGSDMYLKGSFLVKHESS